MKGRVIKSTGSFYQVTGEDNRAYSCRPRGKLRLAGYKESNPVAVGDWVLFDAVGNEGNIYEIVDRTNHVLRQSVKKTEHSSVLAANVDQALLVVTLAQPRTSLGFIDRFMVSCEAYRIPQILIFNKSDLLSAEQLDDVNAILNLYRSIGTDCHLISAIDSQSAETVRHLLKGKTSLIAGHSGVGKSTLINQLAPHIDQKVSEISDFNEKGMHTTTFAEMFQLDETTFIIDTPGVKEWGLVDMNEQEISDYFPEMRELRLECKFGARCIHMNEPKCAILDAVEAGTIAISRYENYLGMVTGKDNRK
jgi:ribosome biogenesis GTPase / thiamine phosphate phosphatase